MKLKVILNYEPKTRKGEKMETVLKTLVLIVFATGVPMLVSLTIALWVDPIWPAIKRYREAKK